MLSAAASVPFKVMPVVCGGADGGVRAECAERDGEAAVYRQVQRAVAFAPVFGEGDVGGRVGGSACGGGEAGGEEGGEAVGGGHGGSGLGGMLQIIFDAGDGVQQAEEDKGGHCPFAAVPIDVTGKAADAKRA